MAKMQYAARQRQIPGKGRRWATVRKSDGKVMGNSLPGNIGGFYQPTRAKMAVHIRESALAIERRGRIYEGPKRRKK